MWKVTNLFELQDLLALGCLSYWSEVSHVRLKHSIPVSFLWTFSRWTMLCELGRLLSGKVWGSRWRWVSEGEVSSVLASPQHSLWPVAVSACPHLARELVSPWLWEGQGESQSELSESIWRGVGGSPPAPRSFWAQGSVGDLLSQLGGARGLWAEVICVIFGLNCVTVHASSPPAETGRDVRGPG